MSEQLKRVAEICVQGSDEERLRFPEVLAHLLEAGIERYHTDLVRHEKTFYQADGTSVRLPTAPFAGPVAVDFSAAGVEAAVRASQAGEIGYRTFCVRAAAAGCTDYLVSLAGRCVVYSGRTGDRHVEHFPPPAPEPAVSKP